MGEPERREQRQFKRIRGGERKWSGKRQPAWETRVNIIKEECDSNNVSTFYLCFMKHNIDSGHMQFIEVIGLFLEKKKLSLSRKLIHLTSLADDVSDADKKSSVIRESNVRQTAQTNRKSKTWLEEDIILQYFKARSHAWQWQTCFITFAGVAKLNLQAPSAIKTSSSFCFIKKTPVHNQHHICIPTFFTLHLLGCKNQVITGVS